ncbi:GNAT family N-acetyltransferase [Pyrococcus abyssi]|uniref:Acetyltransferase (GNAT) family protein n=1 Tax=Pyrococcus abyssi (strain GE5 / Orsay) TaxID=272844 RepID=Q9V2R3_PYRAB|nr:GNAT family N-acetyltransferase [Pyrococcus abyssi]CAB48935.1 Acetyltransferase (GNAT) family protein [Pyrococcus abyssi GE5]CCE69380.1 TPA: hypothetical protein PAB2346 [Pyrococcus abyssi GE5]
MIRVATFEDIDDMVSVFIDAYNYTGPRDSVAKSMEISLKVQPNGCLIAFIDGKPVGMGCIFLYKKVAWVGLMGVKKEYQRRGIGTEIFKRLLKIGKGKTIRLDASSQGYGLYKKFNFTDEYRTVRYELRNRPLKKVEGVKELKEIPGWVEELDKEAFGDDRTRVLRLYLESGARLIGVENEGFGMVYRGRIGPLVAISRKIAEKIMLKAFLLRGREIIVPDANEDAMDLIKKFSPVELTSCTRMRLGDKVEENVHMVFGILTYAKG